MTPINQQIKYQAINLRKRGKTYSEIQVILKNNIPKSTLSGWLKDVILTPIQKERIKGIISKNIEKHRKMALKAKKSDRLKYLGNIEKKISYLGKSCDDAKTAKIALSMLYIAEGSKGDKGCIEFSNSNPLIIKFFLKLLNNCYKTDPKKFRCTVQCRADQDTLLLEDFWLKTTKISKELFYKTSIDPRTIGKPSKKQDYKGVCRINYFSSEIDLELKAIANLLLACKQ